MNILYRAVAHATGDGRNGHVETDEGNLQFEMRIPSELGGPGGGTNPEQLFAAGFSACFHSALRLVASQEKADVSDSAVSATVGIGPNDGGGFGLAVELDVELPALDREAAEALVAKAHKGLPLLQRHPRQRRGEAHRRLKHRDFDDDVITVR
jgi:osmotically inducible protein OsmC